MSTITFGSSIAVWFMKKVSSFIAQCEVLLANQAWMKIVGWSAVAICEMSQTLWQMRKLLVKGDSENHVKVH